MVHLYTWSIRWQLCCAVTSSVLNWNHEVLVMLSVLASELDWSVEDPSSCRLKNTLTDGHALPIPGQKQIISGLSDRSTHGCFVNDTPSYITMRSAQIGHSNPNMGWFILKQKTSLRPRTCEETLALDKFQCFIISFAIKITIWGVMNTYFHTHPHPNVIL